MYPAMVRESKERREDVREMEDSWIVDIDRLRMGFWKRAIFKSTVIHPWSVVAGLQRRAGHAKNDMRPSASACVCSGPAIAAQESARLAMEHSNPSNCCSAFHRLLQLLLLQFSDGFAEQRPASHGWQARALEI